MVNEQTLRKLTDDAVFKELKELLAFIRGYCSAKEDVSSKHKDYLYSRLEFLNEFIDEMLFLREQVNSSGFDKFPPRQLEPEQTYKEPFPIMPEPPQEVVAPTEPIFEKKKSFFNF